MRFNALEKELLGQLLEEAVSSLSNASCNDLPIQVTEENKAQLRRLIRAVHSDDESWQKDMLDDVVVGGTVYMNDSMVLAHFRDRILGE